MNLFLSEGHLMQCFCPSALVLSTGSDVWLAVTVIDNNSKKSQSSTIFYSTLTSIVPLPTRKLC